MDAPPPPIDAHLHLWRLDAPWHGWPDAAHPRIHRSVTLADARAAAGPVAGAIVVQAQTDRRETAWLLDLAAADPWLLGVVGWVALDDPGAPGQIAVLAARGRLVGLRPMVQSIADDGWLLRDELASGVRAMLDHGLRFDALVLPRHLGVLHRFATRWRDLPIVIDHGAKPSATPPPGWHADMAALALLPNVWCKLSGLRTEQPPGEPAAALAPVVDHILDRFGERVLWGSDWPVIEEAGDRHGDWLATAQALTARRSAAERARWFHGAARAFYGV